MSENEMVILDEGVEPSEVAASQSCCKTGQARLQTQDEGDS